MKNIFEMSDFYGEQRGTATRIPVDKIVLTEEIHLKGKFNPENKEKIADDELIVVAKPLADGTYQLVTGWNAYHTAKFRKLSTILCVISEDGRKGFLKKNGYASKGNVFKAKGVKNKRRTVTVVPETLKGASKVPLEKIVIPDHFINSPPKQSKVDAKAEYYKQNKSLPQAVRLSKSYVLYDGYATYLAAKQLGLKFVPAFIKGKK